MPPSNILTDGFTVNTEIGFDKESSLYFGISAGAAIAVGVVIGVIIGMAVIRASYK